MNKPSLTAIILTYNEEIHLQRCLDSLKLICKKIIVVDSFSNDRTKKIALSNSVDFYQNNWVNYSSQFNWALKNCEVDSDWIIRMDADEYLTQELQSEIIEKLSHIEESVSGIELPIRRIFMGKHMKYGLGTIKMIRLFRFGKGIIENRWMDEHVEILEGNVIEFKGEFADHNLNSISWWTSKHNLYSVREAIDLLDIELDLFGNSNSFDISKQAKLKRSLKIKYVKLPLFLRCFIYFIYRYFFRLGFIDGRIGFMWHFLQCFWYRVLVDSVIFEIKKECGSNKKLILDFVERTYKLKLL